MSIPTDYVGALAHRCARSSAPSHQCATTTLFSQASDDEKAERFTRDVSAAPRQDVAYYLEAGIFESGRFEKGVDLLTSNRHLRDALRAKGNRVTYDEFAGGHSDLNWRSGFAKGLLALVGRP